MFVYITEDSDSLAHDRTIIRVDASRSKSPSATMHRK